MPIRRDRLEAYVTVLKCDVSQLPSSKAEMNLRSNGIDGTKSFCGMGRCGFVRSTQ